MRTIILISLTMIANSVTTFKFPAESRTIHEKAEKSGKTVVIDVDDDVEVGMLLGGWEQERPILIRSDGVVCSSKEDKSSLNRMPKYPQGPFVDAGAVHISGLGVILCGGLVGSKDNYKFTNKCYLMDFDRNSLDRLEMSLAA